jgi:putative DNA primase/helicase
MTPRQKVEEMAQRQRVANSPDSERTLHRLSDIGNGARFVADHGANVRYVGDWGCWCVFDGVRWVRDAVGTCVQELAKQTVQQLLTEGVAAAKTATDSSADALTEDEKARDNNAGKSAKALIAHAKKSHDVKKLRDMLAAARSDPSLFVPVGADVFDRRRDLLNCPNGTIELRTGKLRPHNREDFLTTLCPTRFDPKAKCPRFLQFLNEVFPGSPETAEYVRQLSGYMLTGEVSDQAIYLFVGDGSNGKSVLLEVWPHVIGDDLYFSVPTEVLLDTTGNRHPTERAGFRGARLAIASETQEETALNESRVKSLTGSDRMTARFCRQDFFTFEPTHKLFLATNHRPRIRGTDNGIWRRIRLIEFPRRFWTDADQRRGSKHTFDPNDRADPTLIEKLKSEAEGILADAVWRAMEFYTQGGTITPPESIKVATQAYRIEEDNVGQFFSSRVIASDSFTLTGSELREAYVEWNRKCGNTDATLMGTRKFGERAKQLFRNHRPGGIVTYYCSLR